MQNNSFKNLLIQKSNSLIDEHFTHNMYNNVMASARSLIALSLLLTLLINPIDNCFLQIGGDSANSLMKIDSLINRFNFFFLFGFKNLQIMYWVAILVLCLVILGVYPRFTCLVHWWVQYSFINSSSAVEGGDQIASNLLLLLIPIYILDSRKSHWINLNKSDISFYKLIFSNMWFKFIRLQMAVIYFHAAIGKFNVQEWANGTAIYYWLNDPFFKMPDYLEGITNLLLSNSIIITMVTWGSILLELLLFTGLFMEKKYRKYLFVLGICFHFSILLYFGLVSFFISISGGLVMYLCSMDEPIDFKKFIIWKKY